MDCKKRVNVECDRLSNLPDDVIHKILSFVDITHAIETSALSSRWRYIWTSMPCLNFPSKEFHKLPDFSKFVTHVLSGRNNQIEVSSVKLTHDEKVSLMAVKRILNYASSHNVQQMNITFLPDKKDQLPLPVLTFQSLKNLTLTRCFDRPIIKNLSTWKLPALTTLNLHHVTLCYDSSYKSDGLLSNCANLKNFTLKDCIVSGTDVVIICHPGLSSLTLENGCKCVSVDTPQLKNLTIKYWREIHLDSVPNLFSLSYKADYYFMELSADLLRLEKADICISYPFVDKASSDKFVHLLQQIRSVKFLTLNSEIIMSLASSVELISHQASPFTNLKSLKIYPADVTSNEESQPKVSMSNEVKNYLLDSSSGATFTMVSHEEIRADRNVASARKLMRDLQVELDRLKENNETDMDQDKAPMESHIAKVHEQAEAENYTAQPGMKMKWHLGERMTRVESYWEDLNEQMEKAYKDIGQTISMLRGIEEVLTKLPTSHMAKLQARFSGLCAEAGTMMDHLKNQCYKKPRFKCLLS